MSSRTNRAVKGSISGVFHLLISMSFQLLIAPLVLINSGQDTLGGYAVIMQIIGYGILLDFGFSVALSRYLNQSYGLPEDSNRLGELLAVGRNVLFISNILVAILLVFAALNIELFLAGSTAVHKEARIALCLMAIWTVFRTPLIIYNFGLTAVQDFVIQNIIAIVVNLFRLGVALLLVIQGFGILGLIVATIFSELLGGLAHRIIFRRRHRYRIEMMGSIKLGKEMLRFGFGYWGVNLSSILLLGSDNLIAGMIYGAAVASVFYTTKMFGSLLVTIIARIMEYAYPGLNELVGLGDFESVKNVYLRLFRYCLLLSLPSAIGIVIFLEDLVVLWVGSNQFGGALMTYGLALFVLVQIIIHLNSITALALGKLSYWPTISTLSGIVAVTFAYFLGKHFGMGWILISMAISMIPLLGFLIRRVLMQLGISWFSLLVAIKPAFTAAVPLTLFFFVNSFLNFEGAILYTTVIILLFIVLWVFSTWFLGLNNAERQEFGYKFRMILVGR